MTFHAYGVSKTGFALLPDGFFLLPAGALHLLASKGPAETASIHAASLVLARTGSFLPVKHEAPFQRTEDLIAACRSMEAALVADLDAMAGKVAISIKPEALALQPRKTGRGRAYLKAQGLAMQASETLNALQGSALLHIRATAEALGLAFHTDREMSAILVPRTEAMELITRIARIAGAARLSITGPWPPYAFARALPA
jgi:hypothetical protein